MLKGLPLTYDRDMQEDKEPAFDAVDTLQLVLPGAGRHDRDHDRAGRPARGAPRRWASRWPPRSPSGWSATACRSARRTRSPAAGARCCAARGMRAATRSTDDDLAGDRRPHLTPEVRAVLDVARRARGPLTASAAPRPDRVAEQLAGAAQHRSTAHRHLGGRRSRMSRLGRR